MDLTLQTASRNIVARSKPSLAETEANAEIAPTSKRPSLERARSKGNDAHQPREVENEHAARDLTNVSGITLTSYARSTCTKRLLPSRYNICSQQPRVPKDADGKTRVGLCEVRSEECGSIKSYTCGGCAYTQLRETWLFTEKGHDLHKEGGIAAKSRDQDRHIFKDRSGYGTCELMEDVIHK